MSSKKVWFITGAGRGMGVDIAKAALAAGHAVVATARSTDTITVAMGEDEDLLAVTLDVTAPADADDAVKAAARSARQPPDTPSDIGERSPTIGSCSWTSSRSSAAMDKGKSHGQAGEG